MTQIFRESSNSLSLFTLLTVGVGALVVAAAYWLFWKGPAETEVGIISPQPVEFSHLHHVKGAGLDCRFCHAHVESANTAGMPSTEICMSCHSQLFTASPLLEPIRKSWREGKPMAWTRVYSVPDFVYFNHSMHINKGVNCVSCHGHIDEMPMTAKAQPLSMGWCLGCHFHPEKYIASREEVFNQHPKPVSAQQRLQYLHLYHVNGARLRNCYECHR